LLSRRCRFMPSNRIKSPDRLQTFSSCPSLRPAPRRSPDGPADGNGCPRYVRGGYRKHFSLGIEAFERVGEAFNPNKNGHAHLVLDDGVELGMTESHQRPCRQLALGPGVHRPPMRPVAASGALNIFWA
jgi:hypothetical protein